MSQQRIADRWNQKFNPGRPVYLECCDMYSRTLCSAKVINGEAMVYIDDALGPVPLRFLRPEPMERTYEQVC